MVKSRFTIHTTYKEDLHERLCDLKEKHGSNMVCLVAKDEKSADVIIESEIEYDEDGYAYHSDECMKGNIGYSICDENCTCHCHKTQ